MSVISKTNNYKFILDHVEYHNCIKVNNVREKVIFKYEIIMDHITETRTITIEIDIYLSFRITWLDGMFDIKVNIIEYTIEDNEKLDTYDIEYIEEVIMEEYSKK